MLVLRYLSTSVREKSCNYFQGAYIPYIMSIKFYLIFCLTFYKKCEWMKAMSCGCHMMWLMGICKCYEKCAIDESVRVLFICELTLCVSFSVCERLGKKLMDFHSFPETTERIFHTTLIDNMSKGDNMLLGYEKWTYCHAYRILYLKYISLLELYFSTYAIHWGFQ